MLLRLSLCSSFFFFVLRPTPDQSQLDISRKEMCEREWRRRYGMIYGGGFFTEWIVYGDMMMAALNCFLSKKKKVIRYDISVHQRDY